MNVLEYFLQPLQEKDKLKDKLLSKIVKLADVPYNMRDDAKQEIVLAWLEKEVDAKYIIEDDPDRTRKSIMAFARTIGTHTCFSSKREMQGALSIPRRVIQDARERGESLRTDRVDITIVNETEIHDRAEEHGLDLFKLPIQLAMFDMPVETQHIEKDINSGESVANISESSGCERRALQGRLVKLIEVDEQYAAILAEKIERESGFVVRQFSMFAGVCH